MIDIDDYKVIFKVKDKYISKVWIVVLFIIITGTIYINNRFKYCEYYTNTGEYKEKYLNLYILVDDLEKLTENKKIYIKNKEFAYKIKDISKDNIYLNNNYYKQIQLEIDKTNLIEYEVVDIKVIINESSPVEYVFKTVWR